MKVLCAPGTQGGAGIVGAPYSPSPIDTPHKLAVYAVHAGFS